MRRCSISDHVFALEWAFDRFGLIADMNRSGRIVKNDPGTPQQFASFNRAIQIIDDEPQGKESDINNSKDRPLLIWVNDDNDEGEINKGIKSEGDGPGNSEPDWDNGTVDGMRDLVDFFPIYIDVEALVDSLAPTHYDYVLKEATGSLNFFMGALNKELKIDPDRKDKYINPSSILRHQPTATAFAKAEVTNITASGVVIDPDFIRQSVDRSGGVIYIEAAKESPLGQPLEVKLEIRKISTGEVVNSSSLWVQARPVQEMFRHIDLSQIEGIRHADDVDGEAFENSSTPIGYPDERNSPDYFVFLHGFNVPGKGARGWHTEIFKRLYQLGFSGRFIGVTWHGKVGTANYHESVYNAFVTSSHLKGELAKYTPDIKSLTMAAHSLGNMVVSNAIAEEGLKPDHYFMFNAATPIEAYASDQQIGECNDPERDLPMSNCMMEKGWKGYPEAVMSSEWHTLFQADDPRTEITWRDRFEPVLKYAYNFYSEGEDVLENGDESESVLGNILENGFTRHAWVTQEIGKGCQNILFGPLNDPCSAGWKFNAVAEDLKVIGKAYRPGGDSSSVSYKKLSASEATEAREQPTTNPAHLSDEELAQYGFFNQFQYMDLYAPIARGNDIRDKKGPDRSDVEALLKKKEVTWDLLAHAIPARSFAVGANPITKLESKNFNMHKLRDDYWPQERLKDEFKDDWLHSDFRNMALPYVYQVYETMLKLGFADGENHE